MPEIETFMDRPTIEERKFSLAELKIRVRNQPDLKTKLDMIEEKSTKALKSIEQPCDNLFNALSWLVDADRESREFIHELASIRMDAADKGKAVSELTQYRRDIRSDFVEKLKSTCFVKKQ